MNSWFAIFKISAALDSGQPLPPTLRSKIDCSDDLRRFAESADALHQTLKEARPEAELPPSLHSSIMRAVQAAHHPVTTRRQRAGLRWLPVPALAVLLLLGTWRVVHPPAQPANSPAPLATAATALDLGEQMAQTMPSVVMWPLSDEWQRLNRDLDNTAQYLLASLP